MAKLYWRDCRLQSWRRRIYLLQRRKTVALHIREEFHDNHTQNVNYPYELIILMNGLILEDQCFSLRTLCSDNAEMFCLNFISFIFKSGRCSIIPHELSIVETYNDDNLYLYIQYENKTSFLVVYLIIIYYNMYQIIIFVENLSNIVSIHWRRSL